MDGRCEICGFTDADYESGGDRRWLGEAAGVRAGHSFEDLPSSARPGGFATAEELGACLAGLHDSGDYHGVVHLSHDVAVETAAAVAATRPVGIGTVVQVNSSTGGVPKHAVESASVGWRGLAGDVQSSRQHHGHAWQGLCLWSADVIAALQAEGHPIGFGYAGENLTLGGLDWSAVRSGVILAIGSDLLAEVTAAAVPCNKNAAWYLNRDFNRMSHDLHPGWSRWYAAVLAPGEVRPGDEVRSVVLSPSGDRS